MVLLNAINKFNFRQHNAKQNNGYFQKNLKCTTDKSLNKSYFDSTSTAVDQMMEIERYYDAFPALGTPARSRCMDKIPLAECDIRPLKAQSNGTVATHCQSPGLPIPIQDADHSMNGGECVKRKHYSPKSPGFLKRLDAPRSPNFSKKLDYSGSPNLPRKFDSPRSPKLLKKPSRGSPLKDNCYASNSRRATNYYHSTGKARNRDGGRHKDQNNKSQSHQKSKQMRVKESKPWKFLPEVKDRTVINEDDSKPLREQVDEYSSDFISNDILEFILDDSSPPEVSVDLVRDLWTGQLDDEKDVHPGDLWKFDTDELVNLSLNNGNDVFSNLEHSVFPSLPSTSDAMDYGNLTNDCDDAEPENSSAEFKTIEQRLASINFCESMPDDCNESRMMPMFRENPLSYMILHGRSDYTEEHPYPQPQQAFTCKHCQETYEIVLECESDSKKRNRPSNGVLGLIDSRLDFDWCKYHPPPWLSGSTQEESNDEEKDTSLKYGCDCEFCRLRIWRNTCRWCVTPL